ncbi:MAG TPA: helix-hairpin-helix domain-containing protein, partial [Candidatus Baltobacteraceae bacterium]|nr:helix-hairpin-helix domain-containing protein [Candidatus Baltobacteraceae bacterium]
MTADEDALLHKFEKLTSTTDSQAKEFMKTVAKTALTVHVIPSITNELHGQLKERADLDAILVFGENVRRVLMSSPFGPKVVLGIDPGVRTGCKVALIDMGGNFISHTVLHIQGDDARDKAKALLGEVLKKIKIEAIAVGNGTGGREAEVFIRGVLKELATEVPVIMVSESGASVYSASDVARDEFPDLDLTVRGAISIARRLQDPLAELVKIEPKSIGVGQYQHDVNQGKLKKTLDDVVESCVNQVGVEVNTASVSLLQYVSGIGPAIARNLVAYRKQHGLFKERDEFLKVPQFSGKVFEQAAGFLRIADGKVALDRTGIHPERYSAVREMAH